MRRCGLVVILVAAVVLDIVSLSYLKWQEYITLSEGIEINILGVLVVVTIWYAKSTKGIQKATADQVAATREQAEISRKATEIALNNTQNAVLPIVRVAPDGGIQTQLESGEVYVKTAGVKYGNIGKGPALNLRVRLRYDQEECSYIKCSDALGVGEEGTFEWSSEEEVLPLPAGSDEYDVVAEYTDVYRREFISTLFLLPGGQRVFSFRQVPEVEEQIGTECVMCHAPGMDSQSE